MQESGSGSSRSSVHGTFTVVREMPPLPGLVKSSCSHSHQLSEAVIPVCLLRILLFEYGHGGCTQKTGVVLWTFFCFLFNLLLYIEGPPASLCVPLLPQFPDPFVHGWPPFMEASLMRVLTAPV